MEKMMSLEINEEMVKPILEKQIQAAILANIGNPAEIIQKTISLAMKQRVSSSGDISQYSSDNKYDYLELITGNAIRKAVDGALKSWLEENSQLVKAMVIQEMNKPERQNSLVRAFADAVENSFKCSWRFNCDIRFNKEDD